MPIDLQSAYNEARQRVAARGGPFGIFEKSDGYIVRRLHASDVANRQPFAIIGGTA